jgi:hypothetical protein
MKKIVTLFSVVAAMFLMGALPALAVGTGPYGTFGPVIEGGWRGGEETQRVAHLEGTGPYGFFGPSEGYTSIQGAENQPLAIAWGSGPYGVFNSNGMVARDKTNRSECLLVAMYCPLK